MRILLEFGCIAMIIVCAIGMNESSICAIFMVFFAILLIVLREKRLSKTEKGREVLKKENENWIKREEMLKSIGDSIAGKGGKCCPKCGWYAGDNKVARTDYLGNPLYHDNYYKCPKCGTVFNKSSFL